ncbi:unnamed protein product, partial [Parnassius apollo]
LVEKLLIGRGKVPIMEYVPNMEYRNISKTKHYEYSKRMSCYPSRYQRSVRRAVRAAFGGTRREKAGKACKITSSPYKAQLEVSLSKQQHKQQKQSIPEPQPSTSGCQKNKRKKKPVLGSESSSDKDTISLSSECSDDKPIVLQPNDPNADAECMYCFSVKTKREKSGFSALPVDNGVMLSVPEQNIQI